MAQAFEEAMSNYVVALRLSDEIAATEEAIESLIGMAELQLFQHRAHESIDLFKQAEARCQDRLEKEWFRDRLGLKQAYSQMA